MLCMLNSAGQNLAKTLLGKLQISPDALHKLQVPHSKHSLRWEESTNFALVGWQLKNFLNILGQEVSAVSVWEGSRRSAGLTHAALGFGLYSY